MRDVNGTINGSTWAAFAAGSPRQRDTSCPAAPRPRVSAPQELLPLPGGRGQARMRMPRGGHGAVPPSAALKSRHLLISCLYLTSLRGQEQGPGSWALGRMRPRDPLFSPEETLLFLQLHLCQLKHPGEGSASRQREKDQQRGTEAPPRSRISVDFTGKGRNMPFPPAAPSHQTVEEPPGSCSKPPAPRHRGG